MNGANYLRDLVLWLNDRPEYLNDGKTSLGLMKEFRDETGITESDYYQT